MAHRTYSVRWTAAFVLLIGATGALAAPQEPASPAPAAAGNTSVAIPISANEMPAAQGNAAIGAAPSPTAPAPSADEAETRRALDIAQRLAGGSSKPAAKPTAGEIEARPIVTAPTAAAAPAASPISAPTNNAVAASLPAAPAAAPASAKSLIPPASPQEQLGLGMPSSKRAATPSSAAAPISGGYSWIATTGGALAVVIGLILLLRAGFLKLSGQSAFTRGNAVVEVLSRVTLHPKSRLLLVRAGSRLLLLGETPQGINTLAQIDSPEEIAAILQSLTAGQPSSSTQAFQNLLDRMGSDYDDRLRLADEGRDNQETNVDRARNGVGGLLSRVQSLGVRGGQA